MKIRDIDSIPCYFNGHELNFGLRRATLMSIWRGKLKGYGDKERVGDDTEYGGSIGGETQTLSGWHIEVIYQWCIIEVQLMSSEC